MEPHSVVLLISPQSATAMVLMSKVLLHVPQEDMRNRAEKMLRNALQLDNTCVEALVTLAELYRLKKNYNEGIELLQQLVSKRQPVPLVFAKLGMAFCLRDGGGSGRCCCAC